MENIFSDVLCFSVFWPLPQQSASELSLWKLYFCIYKCFRDKDSRYAIKTLDLLSLSLCLLFQSPFLTSLVFSFSLLVHFRIQDGQRYANLRQPQNVSRLHLPHPATGIMPILCIIYSAACSSLQYHLRYPRVSNVWLWECIKTFCWRVVRAWRRGWLMEVHV